MKNEFSLKQMKDSSACVCVWERETVKEDEEERECVCRSMCGGSDCVLERECVCVWERVGVRERERERDKDRDSGMRERVCVGEVMIVEMSFIRDKYQR